jgi:hypothetical protein
MNESERGGKALLSNRFTITRCCTPNRSQMQSKAAEQESPPSGEQKHARRCAIRGRGVESWLSAAAGAKPMG